MDAKLHEVYRRGELAVPYKPDRAGAEKLCVRLTEIALSS